MEKHLLTLLVLLIVPYYNFNFVQGSEVKLSQAEKLAIKRRLKFINKPAIKSFVTQHGDVLDCVEVHKQLAFDHPLLKNHSIQMKPNFKIPKRAKLNDNSSSILSVSQLLPRNMRCPKGTVLIKRIQEKDLMMEISSFSTSNSSKFAHPNDVQLVNEIASIGVSTPNTGAAGKINLWSLDDVKPDQLSDATFYVRSGDGLNVNAIVAGWAVNPYLNPNSPTLYTYWTIDSGKSTCCNNALCPGFVQTSQKVTLGQALSPVSKRLGHQYFLDLSVQQDVRTKNWFLLNGEETVGYWPKELFTSLANGATQAGWGGEIKSPIIEPTPAMGSGHFSKENFSVACLMKWLELRAPQGFPDEKAIEYYMTRPECYDIWYRKSPGTNENHDRYDDDESSNWKNFIYFGGPPGCKH
ncbi:uncharacterized protein LOC110719205 [Chenopodium quinoa]|uniref:uncharacterized protein LOC110719205 n=1 Tax=Chenopodium quinoa TaxID=63459 RepID=UPI000B788D05|nr:uncharacterized protein LOC110719205 [Chenopodium quinoa]